MSIETIKKKSLEEHIPIIMDDTLEVIKEILIENNVDEENSSILIDTIELDEERANEAIKNIKDMNLENTINVFKGNAVEILPTFKEKYDIIFENKDNISL